MRLKCLEDNNIIGKGKKDCSRYFSGSEIKKKLREHVVN